MPSDRQPAVTDGTGRASFPALAEDNRCGHDPGRWLDRPLLDGDPRTSSPIEQAFAVIRGLATQAECRAWRAVERRLDRGPRDQVLDAIESRLAELDEHGERPPLGPERRGCVREVEIDADHEISFSASRRTDGEAEKLGTGRIAQTAMSGSPPDDWTLPDGMEPVAPEPTDTDDPDTSETDSQTNTLAAALGGDGQ